MSIPPSSPRLPSPPPAAEIQIGPQSPSMGPNANPHAQQIEQFQIDAASKRRIHPGTRAADIATGPPLVPLNELDSAFQLQEHLAALHYYHSSDGTAPITRETARILATPPPATDRTLWLYELCRFLIKQCNSLIVGFLFDSPPCSAATCPEMRASEWQFLCAVHESPKSCCAIDYCCHTLDWAANVVTNPKIFPSRFVVQPDGHDRGAALKNLVNVFRRLHRVFAHAWFQHRGVFWSVEGQSGLYVFFKTVCDLYDLLPAENYQLPPEAEGLETSSTGRNGVEEPGAEKRSGQSQPQQQQQQSLVVTGIARPPAAGQRLDVDEDGFPHAGRTNTRRHIRSSPSTGNTVATVPEVDEDDSASVANKLRELSLSAAPRVPPEGEPEVAEVPVIVMEDLAASPDYGPGPAIHGPDRTEPSASEAEAAEQIIPASSSTPAATAEAEDNELRDGPGQSREDAGPDDSTQQLSLTKADTTEPVASESTEQEMSETEAGAGEARGGEELPEETSEQETAESSPPPPDASSTAEGGNGEDASEEVGAGVTAAEDAREEVEEGEAGTKPPGASTIYDEVDENELFEEPVIPATEGEASAATDGRKEEEPTPSAGDGDTHGDAHDDAQSPQDSEEVAPTLEAAEIEAAAEAKADAVAAEPEPLDLPQEEAKVGGAEAENKDNKNKDDNSEP